MACRVPVVVARTQVDAYYFDDSLVRFFQPGNDEDLARAMVEMYRERAALATRIDRAYEFAVRNSWQQRVGDYRGLVESLMTKSDAEVLPVKTS
jgi:glycosyltransferase involved in cell wall biosynthesis